MPRREPPPRAARWRTVLAVVLASCLAPRASLAQERESPPADAQAAEQLRVFEGRPIASVDIRGLERLNSGSVLSRLKTRRGGRLAKQTVREDLEFLWKGYKVWARVRVTDTPQGVHVVFETQEESFRYDNTVFRGMRFFTPEQARKFLELDELERLTEITAQNLANKLEDRYRREGFAFCRVTLRPDRSLSTLTLLVDEGPRVRVRSIRFRGNQAFPDSAFLGLQWNLLGSASVKSKPGLFGDEPFSEEILQEDLDRLRTFYRGRGYKDAVVELQRLDWHPDRTGVDITIRVFEGALYRVSDVDIEQIPYPEGADPLFAKDDLRHELLLKPGDPVTQEALERDRVRLSLFYGRRGFPSQDQYRELDPESSFRVLDPVQVVDPEQATVKVIYRIKEGRRKRVRDVVLRGNRFTRDHVVRRELSVFPGEFIDMEELGRSQDRLLSLRYFGDYQLGDPGVRMRLKPVEGSDELVDLDVEIKEGRTGEILWGVGISTNTGLFGNVQYRKRNFDWKRPPSGVNPIDWFGQVLRNEAFHGGGQTLDLDVAPGTEVSQASVRFFEPDVFGSHLDMIGLELSAYRRLRRYEAYDTDTTGGRLRFVKRFGRDVELGLSYTENWIKVRNIAADAPTVVWDAEGRTTERSLGANFSFQDVDTLIRPASGYQVQGSVGYAPEWIGSGAKLWKAGLSTTVYLCLLRDSRERPHVLQIENSLAAGRGIDGEDTLFLTERYFMGGQNLVRGFDYRGAGPTQFGRPTGGELRYLGSAEYSFPLFSTRLEGALLETELIRGAVFTDAGLLGDSFSDPLFRELRLTAGLGLRIQIPGLGGLPIALDFAFPIFREETDDRQVFSFTFSFM